MSRLLLLVAFCAGTAASASAPNYAHLASRQALKAFNHQLAVQPFARFTVGDIDNYTLTLGGATGGLSGTMTMSVTAVDTTGVTIDQKVNIAAAGQQEDIVEVIDPNTGNIISITENGQPQTPPSASDMQIVSQTLATVTVPAGTFKCQDVKIHMVSENTDAEQWVDMNDVPVGGMLKMTTTEQGIPVEADLTSFTKAP